MTHPECEDKRTYTLNEAKGVKAHLGRVRDKDLRVYQCPHCYGYHLTKKYSGKNQAA